MQDFGRMVAKLAVHLDVALGMLRTMQALERDATAMRQLHANVLSVQMMQCDAMDRLLLIHNKSEWE